MNRRTVLKSGTVLAATADIAVANLTPSLEKLIRRHRHAWQMFNDTCDRADTLSENYDPAYIEINARYDDEEEQSLLAIAAFRTSTRGEEVKKAKYLLGLAGQTYDQDASLFRAMLQSMVADGQVTA